MNTSIFSAAARALGAAVAGSIFLTAAAFAEGPAPVVKKPAVENPARLLFVGNSYLYYGDSVHNHVRRMAIEAGLISAKDAKYKSATISGSALHDHNIDSYLEPGKLRVDDPFQVVILQGGSALGWSKKRPPEFKKTVAEFAAKIRAAGGEPVLYMTHAYVAPHKRTDPGMTAVLDQIYTETGNANNALVIPVGLAFAEAYARKPEVKLHKGFDGSHPSLLGTILAANTVYAALYGSPVGNAYDYFGEIGKEDLAFLQQVAQDTVTKYYGR
jgi:lysophospholipase L1-like esterase